MYYYIAFSKELFEEKRMHALFTTHFCFNNFFTHISKCLQNKLELSVLIFILFNEESLNVLKL